MVIFHMFNIILIILAVYAARTNEDIERQQRGMYNRALELSTFNQRELQVLQNEKEWLTSEVINWYSDFLARNSQYQFHIMSTSFGVELFKNDVEKPEFDYDDWDTTTFPLIIPIQNHNHWFTVVVTKKYNHLEVLYYDFYYQYPAFFNELKDVVDKYLKKMILWVEIKHFKFTRKYQFDDYNCGPFTLMVLDTFAKYRTYHAKRIIAHFGGKTMAVGGDINKEKEERQTLIAKYRKMFAILLEFDLQKGKQVNSLAGRFQTMVPFEVDYSLGNEAEYYTQF